MTRIEHALGQMTLALPDTSDHFFLFPHGYRLDANTVYPGTGVIKRIIIETQAPDIFGTLQIHDLIRYGGLNRFKLTRSNGTVTGVQPAGGTPFYHVFGHFTANTVFGVFATTFNADTLRHQETPNESWIDDGGTTGPYYPSKRIVIDVAIPCWGGMMVYLATTNDVVATGKKVTIEFEPLKSGHARYKDELFNRPAQR